ncbi:MAG: hypothetical protein ACJ78D_02210 [Gemmatimonadaceae bacterium]
MADNPDESDAPAAATTPPPAKPKRRNRLVKILVAILIIPIVVIALWIWVALGYTYSSGDRAGYIQKISKKGWLCKTWEGEIAQTPLPGATPQLFNFTVRSDSIAHLLEEYAGKQVSLTYEQHVGIPTSCFGDTEYFVTKVRRVGP